MHGIQLLAFAAILTATPVAETTQAERLYAQCLEDLGERGNYTWTDGGASAMRLSEACRVLGKPIIDECVRKIGDERLCRTANVLYAQKALQALRK